MATGGSECIIWRPIAWDIKDTPETIKDIKANNAARKAWCNE